MTFGKEHCTCNFSLAADGAKCRGRAKCDKWCCYKKTCDDVVEIGRYIFLLRVSRGRETIYSCKAEELITLPTLPGSGSGSGKEPVTIPPAPGSGSGEQPVPLPGSGSGPSPPMGEGMQCSCKCNCPDGGGECECDCNCPMQSSAMNCASGFTRVCPMMEDTCPEDMDMKCPMNAQSRIGAQYGQYGLSSGCQCVSDFLMSFVIGMPSPAVRMGAVSL